LCNMRGGGNLPAPCREKDKQCTEYNNILKNAGSGGFCDSLEASWEGVNSEKDDSFRKWAAANANAGAETEDYVMYQYQGDGWVTVDHAGLLSYAAHIAGQEIAHAIENADYSASDCATKQSAEEAETQAVLDIMADFNIGTRKSVDTQDNHGCAGETYPVAFSHADTFSHGAEYMCMTAAELDVTDDVMRSKVQALKNSRQTSEDALSNAIDGGMPDWCLQHTAHQRVVCESQANLALQNALSSECYLGGANTGDDASKVADSQACVSREHTAFAEAVQACAETYVTTWAPTEGWTFSPTADAGYYSTGGDYSAY